MLLESRSSSHGLGVAFISAVTEHHDSSCQGGGFPITSTPFDDSISQHQPSLQVWSKRGGGHCVLVQRCCAVGIAAPFKPISDYVLLMLL